MVGLTGCDQVEQAANNAVEVAKQSALQALEEATRTSTINQAKESANQVMLEAKQKATGYWVTPVSSCLRINLG